MSLSLEQADQTSSMGVVWPPERFSNERLRGFYTDSVIRNEEDAAAFAATFREQEARLAADPSVTRLSVRAIVHTDQLETLHEMGVPIEGALPLANTEDGLCIAYMARNDESRNVPDEALADYEALLAGALERPRHPNNAVAELGARDYSVHTVNHEDAAELTPRFEPLYGAFGYTPEDVLRLLQNERNRIVYVTDGDQVVSTAMAEVNRIEVGGLGTVTVAEVTEAYTLPEYRQQGLYRCASHILVERVIGEFGESLNSIYGESNLARPGVIYAAHENGRRFSHFDEHGAGLPGFGILQQNVQISDGPDTSQYNDFALSYIPL